MFGLMRIVWLEAEGSVEHSSSSVVGSSILLEARHFRAKRRDTMDEMVALEQAREQANREELVQRIGRALKTDGSVEPMEGLFLNRVSHPTDRICGVSRLSLCVIAQGAKELYLGEKTYRYDADHFLLVTVELPVTGRVAEASPEVPYLALRVDLEPALVGSVMVEAGFPSPAGNHDAKAVVVSRTDSGLLDALVRLLRVLDSPTEARVLTALIKREIIFRLLTGEQGLRLRHLPSFSGNSHRIAQAIDRLRKEYDRPLRIDSIARDLGMSTSGFHQHFKAVTDMSPLQYQKQLRLQEARRLMLGESLDASSAGYRVGYEDASHFSRDYKKLFGDSPVRDVERLRSMAMAD